MRLARNLDAAETKRFLVCFLVLCAMVTVVVMKVSSMPRLIGETSVYSELYGMGPAAYSLNHGLGLSAPHVDSDGVIRRVDRSNRMPMIPFFLAGSVRLFGDVPLRIAIFKNLLALIPVYFCIGIVLRSAARNRTATIVCSILLFLPFLIPTYLSVIAARDAEEGYFYGAIGLAVVLALFVVRPTYGFVLAIGVTLELIYLTKSSMMAAIFVLLISCIIRMKSWKHSVVLMLLFAMGPLSWGFRQWHVTGKFSIGTSWDLSNIRKGNNAAFLDYYPPKRGNADELWPLVGGNAPNLDEWGLDKWFKDQAVAFIRTHPRYTAKATMVKIYVMLFRIIPDRGNATSTVFLDDSILIRAAALLMFRLMLWSSIGAAAYGAFTKRGIGRPAGLTYLIMLAGYYAPYIIAFGLLRHAVTLVYPAVMVCCFGVIGKLVGETEEKLVGAPKDEFKAA